MISTVRSSCTRRETFVSILEGAKSKLQELVEVIG
jgi:hypothetical protein